MPTEQDPEEFIEEDEQDEIARRSIFSAGWFRALLVLTVLAIVVVVSLPYLLNWLEPTPAPPAKPQAKVSEPATPQGPAPVPAPGPSDAKPQAPAMVPAPTTPTQPSKAEAPGSPPAKTDQPKSAQAPAVPSPADRPVGTAPLPTVPAPATPSAKAPPAAKPETPKAASPTKAPAAAEGGSQGGYWVQVGAFVEEGNAESLARQLKAANFPVAISRVSRGGGAPAAAPAIPAAGGQNQLFITSSTPDAVNAALKGKGTAQAVKGGVVVNPPYDLETAMSLSSSLKKEGFKVVIRRAKTAPAAAPSAGGGGRIFHVVRVGDYPDRAKAQQVRGELESKGHPGFLMQGAAR